MTWFFVFVISSYVAIIFVLLFGWARTMDKEPSLNFKNQFLSVVIPFRNEGKNLDALINDIKQQQYPSDQFEVIFVDDHSEDDSVLRVEKHTPAGSNILLVSLTNEHGKKAAIAAGVVAAKGEIIITTDADCSVTPGWLMQINRAYGDPLTKMQLGAVRVTSSSFFSRLQAMEMTSLMAVTAGTLGWGFPSMCNGANLSFRKSAFLEVEGYKGNERISSGDDEFLMRKISDRWPGSVSFITHRDSIVSTNALPSMTEFIHQRLRWAGKWKQNSSLAVKSTAVLVWLYHALFIAFAMLAAVGLLPGRWWLYGMVAKLFGEALLLMAVSRFVQQKWNWFTFLTLQFFYSPYVVSIGFASQWMQAVWKGRRVKAQV